MENKSFLCTIKKRSLRNFLLRLTFSHKLHGLDKSTLDDVGDNSLDTCSSQCFVKRLASFCRLAKIDWSTTRPKVFAHDNAKEMIFCIWISKYSEMRVILTSYCEVKFTAQRPGPLRIEFETIRNHHQKRAKYAHADIWKNSKKNSCWLLLKYSSNR